MKVISSKRFILWILATSSLITSNIFCADKLMMSNLHSKENYDKYSEPRGDLTEKKKRSLNFEELKDWDPKNVIKISSPTVNKITHLATNLPLRFGRTMGEDRSTDRMANLPLRFGRNTEESLPRRVPNLPQRFGRTAMATSVTKTLKDLLQQPMYPASDSELLYSVTCQPQAIQSPDEKHPRRLGSKRIDDAELEPEK